MEAYQVLERRWAEFNDLDPEGMVACSSGTAALHLALEAFRLPPGSEVIVPNFTMVACPRAVVMAGLTPVFVDCDESLNAGLGWMVEASKSPGVRAVMIVHVYGRRCTWTGWSNLGPMIEDLAEAHGVRPSQDSSAACWSFYKNKIVAGEEGGAVWFRDQAHARLARQLRSLGFTDAHDFNHVPRGHNYRLANCLAEKVLDSLRWAVQSVDLRREVEVLYDRDCPAEWRMPRRQAPWVYDIRIPGLTTPMQDAVVRALQAEGIAARHAFKPMIWQSEFLKMNCRSVGPERMWQSLIASREVLYLPLTGYSPKAFPTISRVVEGFLPS